jgi:hypothetical protein
MKTNNDKDLQEYIEYYLLPDHEKLKIDIIKSLAISNDDLMIKLELFDWRGYIEEFEKEYEELWKYFSLDKAWDGLFGSKIFLERRLKKEIAFRLLTEFIFLPNRAEEKLYSKDIQGKISEIMTLYKGIASILKTDKDSMELMLKKEATQNEHLIKTGKKFSGRGISRFNLKAYELILIKNEEYRNLYGKDNYRRATYNSAHALGISKDHPEEIEKLYKSFKIFQNKSKVYSLEDYKKFLSKYRY